MSNSYKYIDPDYTYTDPNSGLLRNLQDITDPDVLLFVESSAVTKRLQELYQNPIKNKGIDNLFEIHRHLFQDIYIWAGKKRIVEISKDDRQFFPTSHFGNAFRYIDQLIAEFKKIPKENKMSLAAYGKVDSIYNDITDLAINFDYDASQNRLSKRVITTASSDTVTSYYIRDAQGNIMAIYELRDDTVRWIEQDLYGSSRLGVLNPDSVVYPPTTYSQFFHHLQGKKQYELTNHLGNVLTTINDRKIGKDTTADGTYDYWLAAQISGQDYYPGGMVMPERSFAFDFYRFGAASGQEKDNDISGIGNSYTAEYWHYDSRLSRRWNLDPQPRVGISDYSAFGSNPILNIDPNGAYFFGSFGSTAKERQAAKRDAASLTGGKVFDITKKSIHVNYTQGSYSDEEGVTIVGGQRHYRSNGTPETGSVLLDEWHDKQLEVMQQGRLLWSNESGEHTTIVYDGIKPDYTLESLLVPVPKGISLIYNGTIGGISKVTLKAPRLGKSAPVINTYTLEAMEAGYSTAIVGEKVKAGFLVQLNHNIPLLLNGRPWSTLYSRSAATIVGRAWQNQAIGLGLTNVVGGTSLSTYNFNQSISGVQNE